jgi:CheY-like chemotaxis protein
VHLSSAEEALDLIFDYWPGDAPHIPKLVIMDLATAGDAGKTVLRRLTDDTLTQHVPTVAFSANRNAGDMLETFLLGAKMNILKPSDPDEYGTQIERVVAKWLMN